MRSSNRNSGNSRALTVAAAAALLLCTAVQGAEAEHSFVFTAYSNAAGGEQLVSGDYQSAAQITHRALVVTSSDASTISNNRCVALAVTKQWEAARVACNRAVREAQQEQSLSSAYQTWNRKLTNEYVAIALSNRAVLHYLTSESDAAAVDLKRAAVISPTSDFVAHNQAALEHSRTAVAQVAVAPTSH
jgi:hypothetical protein